MRAMISQLFMCLPRIQILLKQHPKLVLTCWGPGKRRLFKNYKSRFLYFGGFRSNKLFTKTLSFLIRRIAATPNVVEIVRWKIAL